jgi:hypothetical protein
MMTARHRHRGEDFDWASIVEYVSVDVLGGPRLHFIKRVHDFTRDFHNIDAVTVAMTVNFGSAHLEWADDCGKVYTFPAGMAHFMEHFVMWANAPTLHRLSSVYPAVDYNGLVTYDQTIYYMKDAVVPRDRLVESTSDIVQQLLSFTVLNSESDKHLVERLAYTRRDVMNEIGYRYMDIRYEMLVRLRAAMYSKHPIQYDALGTQQSLRQIDIEHIYRAYDLIQSNIVSLIILSGHLSSKLIKRVEETVRARLDTQSVTTKFYPTLIDEEPEETKSRLEGVQKQSFNKFAVLGVGIKLRPFRRAYVLPDQFRRMYTLSYLITRIGSNQLESILARDAQAYLFGGHHPNSRFAWDPFECEKIIKRFQHLLLEELQTFRKRVPFMGKFVRLHFDNKHNLLNLCHAADLFWYKLTDLFETFMEIDQADVDQLITEVEAARNNVTMVYASAYIDDL